MGFIEFVVLAAITYFMFTKLKDGFSKEEKAAGYEKMQQGDKWKFIVTPNKDKNKYIGLSIFIFVVCFIASVWFMAVQSQRDPGLLTFWGCTLFSAGMVMLFRRFAKSRFQKMVESRTHEFLVSASELTLEGKSYPASSIARLVTRNSMTGKEFVGTGLLYDAATIGGTAVAARDAIRQGIAAKWTEVAYLVAFESGGNRHYIGTALNEPQAHGLMTEVGNIMGFK